MTRASIRLFWSFWILLGLLWLALNGTIFSAANIFALRGHLMQFSGVLAIGAMSVAMILSIRPRWPEAKLGGLDKMYRLHKWLGPVEEVLDLLPPQRGEFVKENGERVVDEHGRRMAAAPVSHVNL